MRHPLFLLTALALICGSAPLVQGQNIAIDENAVWHEEYALYDGLTSHHSFFTCSASGDTLINGLVHVKIRQVGTDSVGQLGSGLPPVAVPFDRYLGAIRVDLDALAWYVVFNNSTTEQLLYDFDLSIGSELSGTFGDCSAGITVTTIDEVLIAGAPHRRFHLSQPNRFIIEGVGNSSGLFGYVCQFIEEFGCLHYYSVPTDTLFVNGCGSLSTGVDDSAARATRSLAWPNPTSDNVQLGPLSASLPVQVLDSTGRLVGNTTTDAQGTLELAAFASGSYLLKMAGSVLRVVRQ